MGDSNPRSQSNAWANSATSVSSRRTASPVAAIKYAHQAAKLSHLPQDAEGHNGSGAAVRAEWITSHDPIIVTADGGRLPSVPLAEAIKLNELHEEIGHVDGSEVMVEEEGGDSDKLVLSSEESSKVDGEQDKARIQRGASIQKSGEGSLRRAMPPSRTNPLFPPLPLYGPRSVMRDIQCMTFRVSSAVLSLAFLGVIVLGSAFTSIPRTLRHIWLRLTFRDPDIQRPFHDEEKQRQRIRKEAEERWREKQGRSMATPRLKDPESDVEEDEYYIPTEGGHDPLVCDVGYYARRVGLDVEEFKVQTEDGFIIVLWHVYDPREFSPLSPGERESRGPNIFTGAGPSRLPESVDEPTIDGGKFARTPRQRYPILLMHGLLQSSGAYCTNDDDSLAFYLCKSGYDVWLGNNRCGFRSEHTLLTYGDPRMWAWNIRQMGVMDLPALVSRVLSETGFAKLGLICHSQGTTQTFVALAKEQRPDLGDKINVFCALAPAAYAGPLIGKMYLKFMRVISPALFRMVFGIHAFIPFMMTMHSCLPGRLYGAMGYRVFSFLFNWSDARWDRGLRDRMFQFAPVYVSAESMRWWLGRECFAKQKCILATREEGKQEDVEDELEDYYHKSKIENDKQDKGEGNSGKESAEVVEKHRKRPKGSTAWYDEHVPPFALWVCGSDDLVDGRRLLRRFERGREPHVKLVHTKIIEEYEHLDVIWAMDMIEQVGREVKEVLWKTCDVRDECRVPHGCEDVGVWAQNKKVEAIGGADEQGDDDEDKQSSSSDESGEQS
ncbi:MAG: hypothetical protein M1818_007932 [Claussenomyces sp. TS43310]|nr:MAG: hypothetical protein M1818_007932 [Claussenomyces sp. TS43310]